MRTAAISHRGLAAATLAFGFAVAALAGVFLNAEPLIAGGPPAPAYQKDKDGMLVPRMAYPPRPKTRLGERVNSDPPRIPRSKVRSRVFRAVGTRLGG